MSTCQATFGLCLAISARWQRTFAGPLQGILAYVGSDKLSRSPRELVLILGCESPCATSKAYFLRTSGMKARTCPVDILQRMLYLWITTGCSWSAVPDWRVALAMDYASWMVAALIKMVSIAISEMRESAPPTRFSSPRICVNQRFNCEK